MSQATIRKAFETRLKTWADAQTPVIPVAWPNVAFNPPAGRYARADMLPAPSQYLTFDQTGKTWRGVFHVRLCMPIGTGAGVVEALIASLSADFAPTFEQDGLRVYLLSPLSAAPAMNEADRYVVPVSAPYRVDTV